MPPKKPVTAASAPVAKPRYETVKKEDTGWRARLKPFNPDHGHVLQSLTLGALGGIRFDVKKGFYEIPESYVAHLRGYKQSGLHVNQGGRGIDAFDICTTEEAQAIVDEDMRAKMGFRGSRGAPQPTAADGRRRERTIVAAPESQDDPGEDGSDDVADPADDPDVKAAMARHTAAPPPAQKSGAPAPAGGTGNAVNRPPRAGARGG